MNAIGIFDKITGIIVGKPKGETYYDEYKEIFVPRDCALGTFAVADSVFSCYSDGKYVAKDCSGIIWNDTDLNIDWPLKREPVLSKKDQDLCKFVEYKKYEG